MFKTTDGGTTWTRIDSYLNGGYALAIAATNNNVIFAAGRKNNGSEYVMAACYSTDAGASWNRVELTSRNGYAYAIAIHPNNPDTVIVGGYCYTGTNYVGKIFKTMDGGSNWSDISEGIGENYNYVYSLAFDPRTPTTFYAGTSRGVFKSLDGGKNWKNLNTACRDIYALAIHPHTSAIYAAGYSTGVYCSKDGGTNWTAMNDGLTSFELECMVLDSQNDLLFVGTNSGGVFRYDIATDIEPVVTRPALPNKLTLFPNFPNPFNPRTTIRYEIPIHTNSPIQLRIYNVAGQLMKTLVDEIQQAGTHIISWDGADDKGVAVSSGVYLCILQVGNSSVSRKISLIR